MAGSDFSTLSAAIAALTDQVTATETTEAGAAALINGIQVANAKAVADALALDDAADTGSIQAAQAALAGVTSRFQASAKALGDAVVANTPGGSTPPAA